MVVTQLPAEVQALSDAFVDELDDILGDRFIGMFQYGAVCFQPSSVADFDAHVIVRDPFTDEDRARIWEMVERFKSVPLGDDLDVWYVTLDAMRSAEFPQTELKPGFRDESWALHRAHVHAGRFVHVKGPDPRDLVPAPTWDELDHALQSELEDIGDHLEDAPAFAVLNLCRVLYSYENLDVVTSKLQSAIWTLAFVDVDLHALIRKAIVAYEEKTYTIDEDVRGFYEAMCTRIARARALV